MSIFPRLLPAACLTGLLTLIAGARAEAPADVFGDPLPPGAVARLGTARLRHACNALTWAPDGKTLVSSGQDGLLRFWDPGDGKQVHQFKGAWAGLINAITYTPDGKYLVFGTGDGVVHVVDDATGREIRTVGAPVGTPQQITGLGLRADDGVVLTAAADGSVSARDLTTGSSVRLTDPPPGNRVQPRSAVSPDGRACAVWGGDDLLTVYDAAGKELFHATTLLKSVESLQFSPDGKMLAAWTALAPTAALWDVATGKETARVKPGPFLGRTLAFSPDGKALASRGLEGQLHVWDPVSGKEMHNFPLSKGPLTGQVNFASGPIAFSPDGKVLAAAVGTAIRLFDLEANKERGEFVGHVGPVADVRFSPDGAHVLTCAKDGTAGAWDAATGKLETWRTRPQGAAASAVLAPDGKSVLVGQESGVFRWDLTADKAAEQPVVPKLSGAATDLILSADGKALAGYGPERSVFVWDAETGKEKLKTREQGVNLVLALSPDGGLLAVASASAPARLYDVASGKEARRLDEALAPGGPPAPFPPKGQFHFATHMAFAPNGRTLAVAGNLDVSAWEVAVGRERLRVARPGASPVRVAFSPDGRLMAVGANSGAVIVLNATDGWEVAELAGCPGGVSALAFAPDGKTLATAGTDGAVLIWDAKGWSAKPQQAAELADDALSVRWNDLRSGDAVRAYRAVLALARSPKAAAPYLKEKLLAVEAVDAKRVAALIEKLNDDQQKVRDDAESELANMGSQAVPFLRDALAGSPPAETRRRLQELLEPRKDSATVTEEVRNLRALETLERLGAPQAVEALQALAKDAPNAEVKQEAGAALARMQAGAP
jgi:WD40 repeat protein